MESIQNPNGSQAASDLQNAGLCPRQVEANRISGGSNTLTPPQRASMWRLYLEKYADPIIQILLVAALVSLVLAFIENDFVETIGIFIAIFLATTIGFIFERDAAKKFNVLTALGEEQPVKVRRRQSDGDSEGQVIEVARRDVVVGDVVIIETGDEIPADGLLLEAVNLQVDESSLTGEPIMTKRAGELPSDADDDATYPRNMVLRGTMVMDGHAEYRVTAVGDATEIGRVARSSTELTAVKTPLNVQLDKLAKKISKYGMAISIAAFVIFLLHDILTDDIWHGTDYFKMAEIVLRYFMMAVTLIVMAVPEGLPMAVTLALALNMRRMLKSNNLVRKLHACETMGAVTVICTDKTGTLTENRMRVSDISVLDGGEELLHTAIALNTTAHVSMDETDESGCQLKGIGNPTEVALLLWMEESGEEKSSFAYRKMREEGDIICQLPFSTERKYMATAARRGDGIYLFVKGAPEIVLAACSMAEEERKNVSARLLGWQDKAMRTLAFAYRKMPGDMQVADIEQTALRLEKLTAQAVAGIADPVRQDVPAAVEDCRSAGIEVKIVTGDTAATAREIARQIGIMNTADDGSAIITGPDFAALTDDEASKRAAGLKVMCRARPSDKQRLVSLLQDSGEVVAVTGDGTNDAPALNHAHVGLSLGSSTSVAKEASDMTLLDDSFASIVNAVMWGRSLYKNIQRFLYFQLTVNVAALLLVLGGSLIGTEMPLTVTQILWVNLIMDTFAAMALASLPPTREVMADKPRRQDEFIISRPMLRGILGTGTAMFIVLFIYLIHCLKSDGGVQLHELSMFFTTFVMLQFWNLLNAKALATGRSALHGLLKDRGLLGVMLVILFGQWLIVTFGGEMFRTVPLSLDEWLYIIGGTSLVLWIGELWRKIF